MNQETETSKNIHELKLHKTANKKNIHKRNLEPTRSTLVLKNRFNIWSGKTYWSL